jgi:predicted DNA-binding transcriptional regulator AlpA
MHLHNQREASAMTKLSERTLERLRLTGDGPKYVKLGRRVLYRQEDLSAWIASNLRSNTSEVRA